MFAGLKRRMRGIEDFTVRALPAVTVGRLVGVAHALDGCTVIAPLSGRPCLAYVARAKITAGAEMPSQVDVALEVGGTRFVLEDATGRAIVDPDNATSTLAWDYRPRNRDLHGDAQARHHAWLAKYHQHAWGFPDWYEVVVLEGQRIAVTGFGHRDDAGRLTMSTSPHLQLALDDDT